MLFFFCTAILIQKGITAAHPLVPPASSEDFQCNDGFTIQKEQHANMMKCATRTVCILASWVCNGNEDCEDGSDEANCDGDPEERELQSNRVLCSKEEYRCRDGTGICIPLEQTCDGKAHCLEEDDEDGEKCQSCRAKKCGYRCRVTDFEGECYCPDGASLNSDGRTCSAIDFCQTDEAKRCQQYCKSNGNGYQCYCAEKYSLGDDDHSCRVERKDNIQFVIAVGDTRVVTIPLVNDSATSNEGSIRQKYLTVSRYSRKEKGYERLLDYNNHDDVLYITSRESHQHSELTSIVNGTEKALRRDFSGPVHLAVDYVGKNIFYTQTFHSNPGIYVCAADALFCRRIVAGKEVIPYRDYQHFHKEVVENRPFPLPNSSLIRLHASGAMRQFYGGIALNPFTGKMVWLDYYESMKLMMANMDGTDIEELYNNGNALFFGLTIDPFKNEVYFANWFSFTIARMNLKTKERHNVVSKGAGWAYGLKYFDGYLYWTDLYKKTLRSAQIRNTSCTGQILRYFNESAAGLTIKHIHYQAMPPVNPCVELAKTCPWICVIVPGLEPSTVRGKCLCPDNYKQEEGTCILDKNITKKAHVHLLEAHSYVDLEYWKELCSKGTACLNGGHCANIDSNDAFGWTYCNCPAPFIGERCEIVDPHVKGPGWTIFWVLLFFVLVIAAFFVSYQKYPRINELTRIALVRLTRRWDFPDEQLILDETEP